MSQKIRGFSAWETIGMSIPNPRAVVRIPVPSDLTPEQLDELEAAIDRINAEADAELKANQAEWGNWVKGRTP